jgi:hypothetical protein
MMFLPDISTLASVIQNVIVSLGIVAGGVWALFRFARRREHETSLTIDISTRLSEYTSPNCLVLIEVNLKNTCQTKIEVFHPPNGRPVFSDENEELKHNISLWVRRVKIGAQPGEVLDWFTKRESNSGYFEDVAKEINLLSTLETPDLKHPLLCLEPNEEYNLAVPIILTPGLYLLMVTFVGRRPNFDFWRRFHLLEVPH